MAHHELTYIKQTISALKGRYSVLQAIRFDHAGDYGIVSEADDTLAYCLDKIEDAIGQCECILDYWQEWLYYSNGEKRYSLTTAKMLDKIHETPYSHYWTTYNQRLAENDLLLCEKE